MERPVLPSTKTPWFRYPEDLDPVLRDIRDNLDVLDSDVDDIQSGALPLPLAGIAGAVSVSVYTAVPIAGREYVFKKTDSSGNGVVIDPFDTETIDGATTKTITSQHGFLRMVSDGANWRITSQGGTIT